VRVDPKELLLDRRAERIDHVVADRLGTLTLVLEGVHDPHNLAAVLRTAEGLGLQEVHVVLHASGAPGGFRPSAAITQGADKWLDVIRHKSAKACVEALRGRGFQLFASLLSYEAIPLERLPFDRKLALIFGNEHDGVSQELAAASDGTFRIPMYGFTQSFNISVAAAIAIHAGVETGRRHAGGGNLPPRERAALRRRFYALAVKQGRKLPLASGE
jgi:tRNA (guanosine-2'-O-)-methyltransferase